MAMRRMAGGALLALAAAASASSTSADDSIQYPDPAPLLAPAAPWPLL
jgi:hypothetical protein